MHSVLRTHAYGAVIRVAAMLSTVTALVAPRWLGIPEYGKAAVCLALPFLVHALHEFALSSLIVRARNLRTDRKLLDRIWRDWQISIVGCCLATVGYLYFALDGLSTETIQLALMTCSFTVFSGICAWALAESYALNNHFQLTQMYVVFALAQIVGLVCLAKFGAVGFVMSNTVSQIVATLMLFRCRRISVRMFGLLRRRCGTSPGINYTPFVAPRLATMLLSSGMLMIAGLMASDEATARFRITLGFTAFFQMMLPLSPQVLESALTRAGSDNTDAIRHTRWLLAFAFAGAIILATVLVAFEMQIVSLLVGSQSPGESHWIMILGLAFFYFIQPLSSYLLATRHQAAQTGGLIVAVISLLALLVTGSLQSCFALGSFGYVVAAIVVVAWTPRSERMTQPALAQEAGSLQTASNQARAA